MRSEIYSTIVEYSIPNEDLQRIKKDRVQEESIKCPLDGCSTWNITTKITEDNLWIILAGISSSVYLHKQERKRIRKRHGFFL